MTGSVSDWRNTTWCGVKWNWTQYVVVWSSLIIYDSKLCQIWHTSNVIVLIINIIKIKINIINVLCIIVNVNLDQVNVNLDQK